MQSCILLHLTKCNSLPTRAKNRPQIVEYSESTRPLTKMASIETQSPKMDKVSDNVTSSYDWRNERQDAPYRRKLKQKIKLFLLNRSAQKQRRQLFIKNLTPIAHQVERYLYSTASSLDEYCDEETLDMRMMKIVELISKPRRKCKI